MTFKKFIIWIGAIGSLASIVSLFIIFVPSDSKIKLLVTTNSVERLTQDFKSQEPNLKVEYQFKGVEIKNLWKYNIVLQNKSEKTIIGKGNYKNILTDHLTFKLKEGYKILDHRQLYSDLNSKLSVDSTELKISFDQWRENEVTEYSFYVQTDLASPDSLLLKQPELRQIIDGDIVFELRKFKTEKNRITSFLPKEFRQLTLMVVFIFLVFLSITSVYAVCIIPISIIKIKSWQRKNWEAYKDIMEDVLKDDTQKLNLVLEKPNLAPDDFWNKFQGDKFPSNTLELMNKSEVAIVLFLIFVLLGLISIVAAIELFYSVSI